MAVRKLQRWELDKYWLRIAEAAIREAWEVVWGRIRWTSILISSLTVVLAAILQFRFVGWSSTIENLKIVASSICAGLFLFVVLVVLGIVRKPCELDVEAGDKHAVPTADNTRLIAENVKLRAPQLDMPNLKVNWEGVIVGPVYLSSDGVWCASASSSSSGSAYSSVRLQVSNRHVDGKRIGPTRRVSGRVEFTYKTGLPGWTAAPAAWLNEEFPTISVDPGHDKELLVAVRTGKQWNVVTNVRRGNGLPADGTAMQFRDAPWFDATMKVSVISDGEAETREYEWSDIDERIIPRIRPIRQPS
ncbi:MAG TPA: hypothetical protein VN950_04590 [Terriglobales bacterium]|nr:hypothetical protein [Terriglobales bacterium]